MGERREQNRSRIRGRILDGARELFAERGFDDVTVAEIADCARVARATVFNYFASKHAIVDAITEDVFGEYLGMLERAHADDATPTPCLVRALFEQMGGGVEVFHGFYRGVFREIARLQVGLDEGGGAGRLRLQTLQRVEALFARGQARGEISREHAPADLARAMDGLTQGTITHWLYDDPTESLRARMARAAEVLLSGVAIESAGDRDRPLPDLVGASAARPPRLVAVLR